MFCALEPARDLPFWTSRGNVACRNLGCGTWVWGGSSLLPLANIEDLLLEEFTFTEMNRLIEQLLA
jgi:hypothetical protein